MASSTSSTVGNQGILIIGLIVGLFLVKPLAQLSPVVVNSFLLLILLSSLLLQADRWLPVFAQFTGAVGSKPDLSGNPGPKQTGAGAHK